MMNNHNTELLKMYIIFNRALYTRSNMHYNIFKRASKSSLRVGNGGVKILLKIKLLTKKKVVWANHFEKLFLYYTKIIIKNTRRGSPRPHP